MAPEPFRWQRDTPVPPQAAIAWWFDLQEGDHMTHSHKPLYRGKGAGRKILSRSADTVVAMDDYGGGPPTKATVKKVNDRKLTYVFDSSFYHSEGSMTFEPQGQGTRMTLETMPGWKGFGKIIGLFMDKNLRKLIVEDQDAHLAEMEAEWKKTPW